MLCLLLLFLLLLLCYKYHKGHIRRHPFTFRISPPTNNRSLCFLSLSLFLAPYLSLSFHAIYALLSMSLVLFVCTCCLPVSCICKQFPNMKGSHMHHTNISTRMCLYVWHDNNVECCMGMRGS